MHCIICDLPRRKFTTLRYAVIECFLLNISAALISCGVVQHFCCGCVQSQSVCASLIISTLCFLPQGQHRVYYKMQSLALADVDGVFIYVAHCS